MVTEAGRPVLRVIRGDATPEEIAAVIAVLLARAGAVAGAAAAASAAAGAAAAAPRPSAWADRSRQLRRPQFPGPDAWRRSALPG